MKLSKIMDSVLETQNLSDNIDFLMEEIFNEGVEEIKAKRQEIEKKIDSLRPQTTKMVELAQSFLSWLRGVYLKMNQKAQEINDKLKQWAAYFAQFIGVKAISFQPVGKFNQPSTALA